jgi:hypothetical protein
MLIYCLPIEKERPAFNPERLRIGASILSTRSGSIVKVTIVASSNASKNDKEEKRRMRIVCLLL